MPVKSQTTLPKYTVRDNNCEQARSQHNEAEDQESGMVPGM